MSSNTHVKCIHSLVMAVTKYIQDSIKGIKVDTFECERLELVCEDCQFIRISICHLICILKIFIGY